MAETARLWLLHGGHVGLAGPLSESVRGVQRRATLRVVTQVEVGCVRARRVLQLWGLHRHEIHRLQVLLCEGLTSLHEAR